VKKSMSILAAVLVLLAPAAPVHAQPTPTKAELQARFKSRDAEVRELKREGRVGETIDGYVDAVDAATADARVADLLSQEDKDRRLLYQILADEINRDLPDAKVKATPETVAMRNALRNIERAAPNEWLRVAKGHWIRVKEFPRFQKLTKLKTQGKVGETPGGLVEPVNPADSADAAISAVVKEENDARTAEYKALAEKERVDVAVVAERMAKRNHDNARIGDMLKNTDGSWRKK
jgi:uncharacterized protein YdbL (DUF1318 family)